VQGPPDAAPAPGLGGGSPLIFLMPLLLIGLMMWTSRSQAKKQKQLEAALKPGDRVVTNSGLIGKLIEVGERTAKLEIAPGVNVQVLKTSIQGVDGADAAAADAKKDDAKKDDVKDDAKDDAKSAKSKAAKPDVKEAK
jgi:preprotein translocase subunit YajC